MNPAILDLTAPVVFAPVRHHSPACARMVRGLAVALRPAAVLVEGPADFNGRLAELALPHRLPIAIYSYLRLPDGTRRGAFYPFSEHAPEWEALRVARDLGVPARFIDMPWAEFAAPGVAAHRYADGELRASPYVPTLCRRLGVEDFDALWDLLVEVDAGLRSEQIFERVHQLCFHLRAASARIGEDDLRREAYMAAQIRAAQAALGGPLLVVTGGFHSHALFELLGQGAPSAAEQAPTVQEAGEGGAPDERGIALTPYADARLDGLAGYDAGMPSPGFYRQVWRDRAAGRRGSYRPLLAEAVVALRQRGQTASTADLLAVETSAQALAALRGHPEVWRRDLVDAIIGALVKEAIEPDTRHPFLDALLAVFRGSERGALAEGAALPPLARDIRRRLAELGLEPAEKERAIRLDLDAPLDLARSRALHCLRGLGIGGFTRTGGADLVGRADLATVWEQWRIVWAPEQDAAIIEAALYGATLEEAAAARLLERAGQLERSAERAALLLLDACLMGLGALADELSERLTALVRAEADFLSAGAALGHLLYLFRFDVFLGAQGRGDIGALLAECFRRALWLLEQQGQPQGDDRGLLLAVRALVQSFESCEERLALDRGLLTEVLTRIGADAARRPLLRGAVTGALWSLGEASAERVRADLRACAAPEQLGDFLTGLFALAREAAQRDPALVLGIDALLLGYADEAFLHALPALRLAFTFFTPREKHHLARTLLEAHGQSETPLPDLEVDVATAARALALEAWVLEALGRYGIDGGTA